MNCSKARILTNQVTDGLHFGSLEAENQNLGLLLAHVQGFVAHLLCSNLHLAHSHF